MSAVKESGGGHETCLMRRGLRHRKAAIRFFVPLSKAYLVSPEHGFNSIPPGTIAASSLFLLFGQVQNSNIEALATVFVIF
jgi:hypothetical protein